MTSNRHYYLYQWWNQWWNIGGISEVKLKSLKHPELRCLLKKVPCLINRTQRVLSVPSHQQMRLKTLQHEEINYEIIRISIVSFAVLQGKMGLAMDSTIITCRFWIFSQMMTEPEETGSLLFLKGASWKQSLDLPHVQSFYFRVAPWNWRSSCRL